MIFLDIFVVVPLPMVGTNRRKGSMNNVSFEIIGCYFKLQVIELQLVDFVQFNPFPYGQH